MDFKEKEKRVLELTKKMEDELGIAAREIFLAHIRAKSTDKLQENLKSANDKVLDVLSLIFDLTEVFYDD